MAKTFTLVISDVSGPLFSGEVEAVSVPGVMGEMQILAQHAPLISPLKAGVIRVVVPGGETQSFPVASGTLETSENQVTIIM